MGPERLERRRLGGNGRKAGSGARERACARNQTTVRRFPQGGRKPSTVTRGRIIFRVRVFPSAASSPLAAKVPITARHVDNRRLRRAGEDVYWHRAPRDWNGKAREGARDGWLQRSNRACARSNECRWDVPSGAGVAKYGHSGPKYFRHSSPNFCASFRKSRP